MIIQQGDQYAIPIKIKSGNDVITPDNCTDVRIKVDNVLMEYSKGEVKFNAIEQLWQFPLTEKMSFNYGRNILIQIGVKFDDDFVYSGVQTLDIGNSIIKDTWNGS